MSTVTNAAPKPFLKWAGGKSQLLPRLREFYPKEFNQYFEPFFGGGAVFFDLRPKQAHLNDINESVIETCRVIRERPRKLISLLEDLQSMYWQSNEQRRKIIFYSIRQKFNKLPADSVTKSAYLIFLNKTCFNGMYRENSAGEFNVPFGRYTTPPILDEANIAAVGAMLQSARLTALSFHEAVESARAGDFIYFDPPYVPINRTSSFTGYSGKGFSESDQYKLREVFGDLAKRGCLVMLSNSYTPFTQKLYKCFRQEEVEAGRAINCVGTRRGKIKELVILNY